MKINLKKFGQLIAFPIAMLFLQSAVNAQPLMIPGFMGVESSYIDAPDADSGTTLAYFTITNLHHSPIVILSASSDISESASLNAPGHEEVESIIIQPSERLVMDSEGYHVHLNEIDSSITTGESYEVTLLVRRGLEAMEEIEEQRQDGNSGIRGREAGIPNEHDFVINVPVRN